MTYTISEKNLERQQLLAEYLDPFTHHALKGLTLPTGASILDLGCGLGKTTQLLSKHFPRTTLTGVDFNAELIETANSSNAFGMAKVQFITGNALSLPFPDNSFDFVFTRYMLHHIPGWPFAFKEMQRVCKPGGIIFVQEPDINFLQTWPESKAYPIILKVVTELFFDPRVGRKLVSFFRQAGIEEIKFMAEPAFVGHEASLKRFYTQSAIAKKEAIIEKKIMNETEFSAWIKELQQIEDDPETMVLTYPTISVWGRKAST